MQVKRHLTAISRKSLSVPMRISLESDIITKDTKVLDYGCGRGDDVRMLKSEYRIGCYGYDPHYTPCIPDWKFDIVTCFFVLNVIEYKPDRIEVLKKAYSFCTDTLVVAIRHQKPKNPGAPYLDGYITSKHTFQKYFSDVEVKDMLIEACGAIPRKLAPGVWAVTK